MSANERDWVAKKVQRRLEWPPLCRWSLENLENEVVYLWVEEGCGVRVLRLGTGWILDHEAELVFDWGDAEGLVKHWHVLEDIFHQAAVVVCQCDVGDLTNELQEFYSIRVISDAETCLWEDQWQPWVDELVSW